MPNKASSALVKYSQSAYYYYEYYYKLKILFDFW